MAKKKVSKKKVTKKKVTRKVAKKTSAPRFTNERKLRFSLRRFLFFAVFALLSFILYSASGNEAYKSVFELGILIFGSISLAFLLIVLIFLFLRLMKKR